MDRHCDVCQLVRLLATMGDVRPFPFVGREDELACLHSVWETARGGAAWACPPIVAY